MVRSMVLDSLQHLWFGDIKLGFLTWLDLLFLKADSFVWKEKFIFEHVPAGGAATSEGNSGVANAEYLLLKQLPAVFTQRHGPMPESVLIRDCYRELYDRAAESMLNPSLAYMVTAFQGQPGTGKSVFLVYFIYRFLRDDRFPDKRFILEFQPDSYLCWTPTGEKNEFHCTAENWYSRTLPFLKLCDIPQPYAPSFRAKSTFLFSSPVPGKSFEILKNYPCGQYTLPTWTESELSCLGARREDVDNYIAKAQSYNKMCRS